MRLSFTATAVWQPTPQNGHNVLTTLSNFCTARFVAVLSINDFSYSAPVGHACTHSPHVTQVERPIGSWMSNTGTA